ncbi:response regulator transcription factor [Agrobacterium tumefaciens]|nr:response regulator transcription factor [Agrobacterium tumefaciens]NTE21012.1 response regulator transcription factor [Agrobacterium tumefaciens]
MYYTKRQTCIIIDDDEFCIEILKDYINKLPQLELMKTYTNPLTAIKDINLLKVSVDFLFLDINMPKISGLELASLIRHKVDKLIFTTAHSLYSLAAYDVLCNQYLLKPFSFEKFSQAIDRLINLPDREQQFPKDSIFIKSGNQGKYLALKFDDIIYFNALEHYVIIHTLSDQYVHHLSLKEVEYALRNNHNFIRIHKSHIISKNHIQSIHGNTIVLTNKFEITIGTTFKQSFNDFLNSNLL